MSKDSRRNRFFARSAAPTDGYDAFSKHSEYLPLGVSVCDGALCADRLLQDCESAVEKSKSEGQRVKIAAFDFDGTCIDTSSPRLLVFDLWRHNLISQYKAIRMLCWGAAYKLNLPRDEEAVRRRVFSAFLGRPAAIINKYLFEFYFSKVEPFFLPDADAAMAAHIEEGHVVIVVSATFEPIIAAAMTVHPIQFSLSTRMKVDRNGIYTDEIDGIAANGPDKVVVLKQFLDEKFGENGWEIAFAYGDHYSDIPLLSQAQNPCPVDPDQKLRRYANSQNWAIQEWK